MNHPDNSISDMNSGPATAATAATATDDGASSVAGANSGPATPATNPVVDALNDAKPAIVRPSYWVYDDWATVGGKKYRPGVWLHTVKQRGEEVTNVDEWVCSPLHIEAVTSCDERDFGRLLRFRNSLGGWKQWAMPMSLLKGSGDDMRGELLSLGVEIDPINRTKLAQYLFSIHPDRHAIAADKTGWHGDRLFVLPDQTIGDGDVVFQSPTGIQTDYGKAGTLDEWQTEIGGLCTGNHFLVFSVCCALGGPLFTLLHKSGAGVHFGGDSSKGKTTGAYIAASVWGHGKTFISTWRATSNGLEGDAAMRNDTVMILDEMKQADPRDIDAVVYMIANGKGKKRANRSGLARPSKHWNLFLMSNGESSLEVFMRAGGLKVFAGQDVRLPTVPVTTAKHGVFDTLHHMATGKLFADHLQTKANTIYGHLGPAFIEALIASDEFDQLSAYAERFQCQFPASGEQEGRVAGNFAIIAMAGELAIGFDLVPWAQGDALNAALAMFSLWKDNRAEGNAENSGVVRDVRAFINKHGGSRFESLAPNDNHPVIRDRAGWLKEIDGHTVYLFTDATLNEASTTTDATRAAQALRDADWLHDTDSGRLTKNTRVGGGTQRLYWVAPRDAADE